MDFCHLHLHTEYSLLDGVAKVKPLLEKVKSFGMNSCAITDHGVMYGVFEFWNTCKELDLKPIIGCEVYIAPNSRFDKNKTQQETKYNHLTLLAKNKEGYHNLVKLVSLGFKEGFYYKPRVDKELLSKYSKGIICLTGCAGSVVNARLLANDFKKAHEWMDFIDKTFEDKYMEIMRTNVESIEGLEQKQLTLNEKFNFPIVGTCDTHYIEKEDWKIQEIAWCISDGKLLSDPTRRQYDSKEFYLKSPKEVSEIFSDLSEAIRNTQKLADSVEKYDITYDRIQPIFHKLPKGKSAKEFLYEKTIEGAIKRYGNLDSEKKKRIDEELEIIHQKGYDHYFLVVMDYCHWAQEQGILIGPGRGSGAGSLVAYCLSITNIDPLKWDLIFERFLNPERDSPPDFDIDFQDDRRDELFAYMSKTYGPDNTSFIGTFGRMKTKAAIRDVARVMGIDLSIADKLSKMVIVRFGRVHSIDRMIQEVPEFKQMIESSPELQELAGYVRKLENVARHVSTHACGYLVTPKPVIEYVPVQKEPKGGENIITQIEGWVAEYMGLMKFDFLGLSNLTIIKNVLKQIEYTRNEKLDINLIPLDDKKTFELFQQGNTTGIFQFESEGMKKHLKDLQPTELEDLIFLNAAYRPGPMQYIPDYIKRKKGQQKVNYLHPSLEPILKSTFGFAIYQEQVMKIAVDFAGYSLGQADILRRAMGKKKPEIMKVEKNNFVERAKKNGHNKALAQEVFAYLEPFADYGFNRSHSACYSLIAYQTAYLKANYPLEFMAGLMQTDLSNAEKISRDMIEAQNMSIPLLPPDINESFVDFKIEKNQSIRFGLGAIKNSSTKTMQAIIKERKKNGTYNNLDDLINRVKTKYLTKKDLECLIKVGAMDLFGYRNQLLTIVPICFEKIQKDELSKLGGQTGLFNLMNKEEENNINMTSLPTVTKETNFEKILWEKEMIGTFLSSHPISDFIKLLGIDSIQTIDSAIKTKNQETKILCMISSKKVIYTKKTNEPMAFVEIEDTQNKIEGVIFPKNYKRLINHLEEYQPIILTGRIDKKDETINIVIEDIALAKDFTAPDKIVIHIFNEKNQENLTKLKELIIKNPGSTTLEIVYGSELKRRNIIRKINPTAQLMQIIKNYQIN